VDGRHIENRFFLAITQQPIARWVGDRPTAFGITLAHNHPLSLSLPSVGSLE